MSKTSTWWSGFGATYRFAVTTRATRYRFRALVPREATYPYDTGASRPVASSCARSAAAVKATQVPRRDR